MKKILLIVLLALAGCSSIIEAYSLKYDTNEYLLITEIRTAAGQAKNTCDDYATSKINANLVLSRTIFFVNFTQYSVSNSSVKAAAIELNNITSGLVSQYSGSRDVGTIFCKLKFENIESNAEIIQKAIGAKPK